MTWAMTRLKRVVTLRAGGTPAVDDSAYWAEEGGEVGMAWVAIGDMTRSPVVVETSRRVTAEGRAAKRLPVGGPGTLLFAMYASVGATAVLGKPATWNQAILGIDPLGGKSDLRFVRYWLDHLRPTLAESFRSNTQDNLNADQVGALPFPAASVADQRAIADYLDTETARIDALVAKKRRLLGLFKARVDAWRSGALTGTGRATSIPSIPAIPEGWDLLRNKIFLREINDPSPDGSGEMLSVSHLTGVTPRREKTVHMFEAESTVGYKRVRRGDLVINTMWAWMGAAGVSRFEGIVSPAYGVYRFVSTDVLPDFYDVLVRSPAYIEEMTRYSRGVTSSRLRLYPEEFLALRCPVPPIADQARIAADYRSQVLRFETLDQQLAHQIDLLVEHRQALITAAVTGELEIPGVAA